MAFTPTTNFVSCPTQGGGGNNIVTRGDQVLCNQLVAIQQRQEEMFAYYFEITGRGEFIDGTPLWEMQYLDYVNIASVQSQLVPSSGTLSSQIADINTKLDNLNIINTNHFAFGFQFVVVLIGCAIMYLVWKIFNWYTNI